VDLTPVLDAFESSVTPLIRTDFSADGAWRTVIAQVTKPVDFDDPEDGDPGGDGYAPNVTVIDDPAFRGMDGARLGEAVVGVVGEIAGYVCWPMPGP